MREKTDRTETFSDRIRQLGTAVEKGADRIFLFLCIIIFGGLTFYSLRYTEILHEDTEIPWTVVDSVGGNMLALLIVTVAVLLLGKLFADKICVSEGADRKIEILAGIVTIYVAVICLRWVSVCHICARADGRMLCMTATSFMYDIYDGMLPSGYMYKYPHQFGLLAVIHILYSIFGIENYQSFQYMNALCMPLLFYSGYKILRLICKKPEVVIYYILLFVCYIPMFLYVAYIYGEISSTAFAMMFMWQIVRYCKTGKKSCYIWGTLAIVFACIMRSNSVITLVAAGIVLITYAFRKMKPQTLIWIAVMFLMIFAANRGIKVYYEKISGLEVSEGIPHISWVYMGLKDGSYGPGWFDGSSEAEFELHGFDTEQTALDQKEKVMIRLRELWDNKAYGIDFFRRKILTQWNAPMCHGFFETKAFICEPEELPKVVHRIYYEDESAITVFMDRYQFVLYFYLTAGVLLLFIGKKKERRLEDRILLITIVGGFLFHIIWEVMGRYALPYVIYMIPMAAMGMGQVREILNSR